MGTLKKTDSVMLARNWSTERVHDCLKRRQKFELIRFLDERYSERFFRPINCLRRAPGNEHGYGFAIMALCSLLVETIQGFRDGLPNYHSDSLEKIAKKHNKDAPEEYKLKPFEYVSSERAFEKFFGESGSQERLIDVKGKSFYKNMRCGLLHQAQTEDGWRLVRTGRYWDFQEHSINRDEFAERLEQCFRDFLKELEEHRWDDKIWKCARKKIWWLVELS